MSNTDSAPRSPMQSPDTWNAVTSGYAEHARQHALAFAEEALRRVPAGPDDRVLDLASGPGTLALLVAPKVARVTAVDFSSNMIDELRAHAVRGPEEHSRGRRRVCRRGDAHVGAETLSYRL